MSDDMVVMMLSRAIIGFMMDAFKVALVGKKHPQSIANLGTWHDRAIGPLIVACLLAW